MLHVKKIPTLTAGYHHDGGGLYLQITPAGSKSWIFRYQRHGRRREMGLGSLSKVGLAKARQRASEARQALGSGLDPIAAREAEKAAQRAAEARGVKFRDAALAYVNSPARTWRNGKSRHQWVASLGLDDKATRRKSRVSYLDDDFLNMPVESITVADVRKVLESVWYHRPVTASRVRGRIQAIIDAARADDESRWSNPALLARHRHVLAKQADVYTTVPHPSLPHQHVAEFMAKLVELDTEPARALALLTLTAVRSGAVLGARWPEFDLAEKVWTVPVGRTGMKGRKQPLRVPLSDASLVILKKASKIVLSDRRVFHCGENGLGDLMADLKLPSDVEGRYAVPHGLRSTFKNWAIEMTGYPDHVSEAALGHASADKVRSAYARSDLFDMRRQLMAQWGYYCTRKESNP